MVDRLPLAAPFAAARLRWRLVDARLSGPGSFGLPPETITTDGGGWWEVMRAGMDIYDADEQRAMRAVALRLRGGRRIDVPFQEESATGGLRRVTWSDGTLSSDGTGIISGAIVAYLAEPVALRADEAVIDIPGGPPLLGGDAFSLFRSPALGSELHATEEVERIATDRWRVRVAPQFRQAHPAGAEVNFNDPACAMRVADAEGLWPEFEPGWIGAGQTLFREALR